MVKTIQVSVREFRANMAEYMKSCRVEITKNGLVVGVYTPIENCVHGMQVGRTMVKEGVFEEPDIPEGFDG